MKTEFFQSLGLNNSEIRVYLALLSKGQSDARTIYRQASVPFGKIYDLLYSLENRGLVRVQYSRPKKFLAVEPKIAIKSLIDSLIESKEKELQSLFNQAAKIEEDLTQICPVKTDKGLFWSVAMGMENGIALFNNILNEAKREVLMCLDLAIMQKEFNELGPEKCAKTLVKEMEHLLNNIGKNVMIKILLEGKKSSNMIVSTIQNTNFAPPRNCELRITSSVIRSFVLIDGEKILLDVKNPIAPNEHLAAIYIWEKSLGKALKDNFEMMWKNARPIRD
jgi:sugar-specific transcriptional regulator TrmB